jgi:hypothetical protein
MLSAPDVLTLVNRSACGCYDPWIEPVEGIGYYTALIEAGLFISTVLDEYGCSGHVYALGWHPCLSCGRPDIHGYGKELGLWQYDPAHVTPAGLLEAHEALVAQVRSGRLPTTGRHGVR